MKLVYLDTSHFDLLAKEYASNTEGIRKFLARWHDNEVVLALSKVHLEEMMRSEYPDSINKRFVFLKAVLPIRYESVNFFEREIYSVLFLKGLLIQKNVENLGKNFFTSTVSNEADLALLHQSYLAIRKIGIFRMMAAANRKSWGANAQSDQGKTNGKARFKKSAGFMGRVFAWMFFALTGLFGIERPDEKNIGRAMDRTLDELYFRLKVKFTLSNRQGISIFDKRYEKSIVKNLRLAECKGLWLRNNVEKRLKRAHDFDSSNENDLNHVQYFPYVDIFLSDRRIVDKIGQVIRSEKEVLWLQQKNPPIKTSYSLESLERALFGTTNRIET